MNLAVGLAALGLIVNAMVWGLSWIPFRALDQAGIHPLWSTAMLFSLATLVLGAARPRAISECLRTPALLWLALACGLTNAFFNTAVATGDVVRVVLLFYLMPVWAALLARWLLGEPLNARSLARVAVGVTGALLVLHDPGIGWPLPRGLADWLALAGGATFALNTVLLRRLAASGESARTIAMLGGGTLLAAGAGTLLSLSGTIDWPTLSAPDARTTLALWSVLFLLANLGLQYGAARLPANVTAVIMLTEVLVASASAWWAGAAELRPQDLVGGALIIAAPWLFTSRVRRGPATAVGT